MSLRTRHLWFCVHTAVLQRHCVRATRTLLPTKMSLVIVFSFLFFLPFLRPSPGRLFFWSVAGLLSCRCCQTTPELNGIKQMPLQAVSCHCCDHLCQNELSQVGHPTFSEHSQSVQAWRHRLLSQMDKIVSVSKGLEAGLLTGNKKITMKNVFRSNNRT